MKLLKFKNYYGQDVFINPHYVTSVEPTGSEEYQKYVRINFPMNFVTVLGTADSVAEEIIKAIKENEL